MRSFIPHVGWLNHADNEELVTLLQRGYFEAAEQAFFWLYLRPGDSIIDCGAHIGLYSLLACKATNGALDLTAIEANSDTFYYLKRNLDHADFRTIGVLNAAVWDRSGNLDFIHGDIGKSAYSHVDFGHSVQHQVKVPAIILDDVVEFSKTIALVKIDVEGSESEALTGACRSISERSLPLIMIEFTEANLARRGRTSGDLARQLESSGYQLCEFCTDKLELVPFQVAAPIWYKNIFACLDFRSVNSRLSSARAENRQIALDVIARARACSLFSELEKLERYEKSAELLTETRQWALRTEHLLARERQQLAQTEEWAKRAEGHLASARLQLADVTEWARRFERELSELKPFADTFSHLHKNFMKYKDLKGIDICICTHNPRPDVLHTTICSIIQQDVSPRLFNVVLVDNGCSAPLEHSLLDPLVKRGIACRIVRESRLGIASARRRAIQETNSQWIVFVDDDNELSPDFLSRGFSFIRKHPDVGCFGGRILLPYWLQPPSWVIPFLPFLAIKDEGDEPLFATGDQWGPWEPPTAGAWVHRKVLNEYLCRSENDHRIYRLGRVGRENLNSCEDSIMMRGSSKVGLKNAYAPELVLTHHLERSRFSFRYLMRLMYAFGLSHVMLERILTGPKLRPDYYGSTWKFLKLLNEAFLAERKKSIPFAIGKIAYHLGARREHFSAEPARQQ